MIYCFNSKIRTLVFLFFCLLLLLLLFNNKHADLHTRIKQNIVWNRLAVKNETKKFPHDYPDAKAVKTNLGYDASSMYLYCMGQDMPTGYFHRRRAERNFRLEKSCPQSQAALGWLNHVRATEHIFIQHAGNSARGKKSEERKYPWMDSMPLQTQSMSLTGVFFMRARVSLTASQTTPKSKNWPSKQSVPNKSTHTSDSWVTTWWS